jgi:hypothetical protein
VITDRFVVTARAIAELNGMPDYPFAVIAHPIANNGDAELRAKAEQAVDQIVAILTRRPLEARQAAEAR